MTLELSNFREWMTPLAWVIAGGLLVLGILIPLLLRRVSARLRFTVGVLATWGGFCLLAHLPTPRFLIGDGYAVTAQIGVMGATYSLPFVVGTILSCGITALIKVLCRMSFTKRRSPSR